MRLALEGTEFEVADEGSGPAIVLLHDFGLAKEAWDAQSAALRRNARVVRPDLRGMGRSSVPPGPYLMEQLAGDVAALCDALGVERAVVAGHGLGGFVAFEFFRMFAERCTGLALLATRGDTDGSAEAAARFELAERVEREGLAPLLSSEPSERARGFLARSDPLGLAAMLRGIAMRAGSEDLYSEIDLPVCVLAGADDPGSKASRAIAAGIRGARLDLFDCGRLPLWEVPDAVTASFETLLGARVR